MGNFLQLRQYELQYGKQNIYKVELEEDGSFYMAVHNINIGRIQQDMDAGSCFLWQDRLIYTRC